MSREYKERENPIKLKNGENREDFLKRCTKREEQNISHKEALQYCRCRYKLLITDYDTQLIDRFIYNSF